MTNPSLKDVFQSESKSMQINECEALTMKSDRDLGTQISLHAQASSPDSILIMGCVFRMCRGASDEGFDA
jgi:hypothetical protein